MNFLGHLYFSNNDFELMQANLFGDFIKGKDYTNLPLKIQEGITLHRKIDYYIDNHDVVVGLLHRLYEPLPKVAAIAVDLYFDHLLAKNWSKFHDLTLEQFTSNFYKSIDTSTDYYTSEFQFMLSKMQEKNWLLSYKKLDGLHKSCLGVSSRISFPNKLIEGAKVFKIFEKEIEDAFFMYMFDAQKYFFK